MSYGGGEAGKGEADNARVLSAESSELRGLRMYCVVWERVSRVLDAFYELGLTTFPWRCQLFGKHPGSRTTVT